MESIHKLDVVAIASSQARDKISWLDEQFPWFLALKCCPSPIPRYSVADNFSLKKDKTPSLKSKTSHHVSIIFLYREIQLLKDEMGAFCNYASPISFPLCIVAVPIVPGVLVFVIPIRLSFVGIVGLALIIPVGGLPKFVRLIIPHWWHCRSPP